MLLEGRIHQSHHSADEQYQEVNDMEDQHLVLLREFVEEDYRINHADHKPENGQIKSEHVT
jgi:hypothetical protein